MECLLITIATAVLALPAPADPNMDAWRAVTAAYSRCDGAATARNAVGTLAIDTQGYQILTGSGKVLYTNGPKMLAQYNKTYEGAAQVRQKTTLQKLSLKSGVATAIVYQKLQLSAIDPNINNWRTWVIEWKMQDTWINAGGIWKRKRTVMLNQSSSKHAGPVS